VLAAAWGGNHFSPLLLLYRQVDGYSSVEVDLFFAFYILGLVPGFLVAGPLSDRHGRKRLVAVALALGVLGSVVLALGSTSVLWMCAGRFISGLSVATAMVVGSSWIKELSQHDAGPATRARRASLTLTAGFGLGAGISGALAQWGPAPTLLPYLVHIALSAAAAVPLRHATETGEPGSRVRSLLGDLRVPPAARRRFYGLVVPMAPWVFSAPALSFVIAPSLVADRASGHRIAFATLLAVVTLCCGAAVQSKVALIPRAPMVALVLIAVGTVILAVHPGVLTAIGAAVLFGLGYGIAIVSGLIEVQAMAAPESLAGLTGIYYSLTYLGFALPVLLAALAGGVSYPVLLWAVAGVCAACAVIVSRRRPIPA
jgi:MFS family permease